MDIIYITNLKITTIIGIYDWERKTKQTISINLSMATNIKKAAATEDITYTLNYKTISKRLIAFIEASNFLLVETMAEKISQLIMQEFNVPWLRLKLSKPLAITGADDVGVIIERGTKT